MQKQINERKSEEPAEGMGEIHQTVCEERTQGFHAVFSATVSMRSPPWSLSEPYPFVFQWNFHCIDMID